MRNDNNVLDKIRDVINIVEECLGELKDGSVTLNKLIITKALRSQYKNPDQIAHNVLANRIEKRDPGNKPKPGERMKFIHIIPEKSKDRLSKLQGTKIETLSYIEEKQLKVDFNFYITNQLFKPIQQLLMLSWKEILLCKNTPIIKINSIEQDIAKCKDAASSDKIKSGLIKKHLFDYYINNIISQNHQVQKAQFITKNYVTVQKDQSSSSSSSSSLKK
jgi:hypothetical protein